MKGGTLLLNMSDGIHKIKQQLQHIASESQVDQSEERLPCVLKHGT